MTDATTLLLPNQIAVSSDCLYNLKPSSVRARSYRASIPSSNKSTFSPGDTIIAYIPGGRKNTYLDPCQSYVRFTVRNNDTTAAATMNIDNLASCFFNRLDTYHSGNLIDSIQQYNVLMSYIKDAQLNLAESYGLSNIYGTSNTDAIVGTAQRQGSVIYATAAGTQQMTFCMPLLGAFGLGADKMIPIGQLYDDIRLELSLEQQNIAAVYSANPTSGWTIQDFQLELQIIELSDDGQHMVESVTPFHQPVYLHCNSWRHYSSSLATNTSGVYSTLVPARFASLKSLVCLPRRSPEINDRAAFSTSCRINPCIQSYWWRVGAYLVPQRFITLQNATNTGGCGEAFIELQKAFHGVNRPEMCTGLNFQSYNCTDLATADTTVGGIAATGLPLIAATSLGANSYKYGFAIAQEMESFAQKDGLLLSGMNTLTSQVFWEANLGWGPTSQTNQATYTLDFYSNFDMILMLENGILSARF